MRDTTAEKDPLLKVKSVLLPRVKWFDIAFVMAAEVIGTGVLAIPKATQTLGWALSTVIMILGLLGCMFAALLQMRVAVAFPEATSMAEAAYCTVGSAFCGSETTRKCVRDFVSLCVYSYTFLVEGGYILILAKSLGGVFFETQQCLPIWVIISMGTVLPVLQYQNISDMNTISFCNLVVLTAAILVCLITMGKIEERQERPRTDVWAINTESSVAEMIGCIGIITFAYGGNWMYFEIMSEMEAPGDFMKAFWINAPLQLSVYLICGLVAYAIKGKDTEGYMLDNLPFGNSFRLASLLLNLHMMVSVAIISTALSRYVQDTIGLRFIKNRQGWLCITFTLLVAAGCLAMAVPFFNNLIGLIGSMLLPPICFVFPILIFLSAKYLKREKMPVPLWYWPFIVILFGVSFLLSVVGTMQNIREIRAAWSTFGAPFSCHCESMWKTCDCSAARVSGCSGHALHIAP